MPPSSPSLPSLDEIACEFATDKSTRTWLPPAEDGYPSRATHGHGYTIFYEYYFRHLRLSPIRLLEIGVLDGRSLATWKVYFPHAKLYGLDIDPSCRRFEDDRVRIFIGSQADASVLASVREHVPDGFDVIIDDGSHYVRHVEASFAGLFGHLREGGIYAIEDLHVSAASDWGSVCWNRGMALQQEPFGNDPQEMVRFLKAVRARPDVAALTVHLKKLCFIHRAGGDQTPPRWERGDSLDELYPPPPPPLRRLRRRIGSLLRSVVALTPSKSHR
jgi:hypothetical protein